MRIYEVTGLYLFISGAPKNKKMKSTDREQIQWQQDNDNYVPKKKNTLSIWKIQDAQIKRIK